MTLQPVIMLPQRLGYAPPACRYGGIDIAGPHPDPASSPLQARIEANDAMVKLLIQVRAYQGSIFRVQK